MILLIFLIPNIEGLGIYNSKIFLNRNLDYEISKFEIKIQNIEQDKLKKQLYPKLTFNSNYSNLKKDNDEFIKQYNAKIMLSGKLYDGGYNKYSRLENLMKIKALQSKSEMVLEKAQFEYEQYAFDFESSLSLYLTSIANLKSLEVREQYINRAKSFNLKDSTELLKVKKEIEELEVQINESFYKVITSYIGIQYLIGNLDLFLIEKVFYKPSYKE
jgi:hypothetical protein